MKILTNRAKQQIANKV